MPAKTRPAPRYLDFQITLNRSGDEYTVEARGPREIAIPAQPAPPFPFKAFTAPLEALRHGGAVIRGELQALGEALHAMLFPPAVRRAFTRSEGMLAEGEHLRLKLAVRPPELCALPWELLYAPEAGRFLGLERTLSLTRFIESEMPSAVLPGQRPLRLLAAAASPADLPPLAVQASAAALHAELGLRAEIVPLLNATPPALQDALRQPYHIFHFDGHAVYDEAQHAGALCLQNEAGATVYLSGERLAQALAGTTVRLVVLAACETAATSSELRNTGIAYELMKTSSLPAVVAMQFPVQDHTAAAFLCGFYGALADDYPLDAALVDGRQAMLDALGDRAFSAPDWAAPVLFLRPGAGNLFSETGSPEALAMTESPSKPQKPGVVVNARKIGSLNTGNQIGGINVTGPAIISQGDHANIQQNIAGASADEIAAAFARLHQTLAEKPASPKKALAEQAVQGLETEARKGAQANADTVEEWLNSLLIMLPDIGEVALQTFINPIAGVSLVFQKIARKAQEERRK